MDILKYIQEQQDLTISDRTYGFRDYGMPASSLTVSQADVVSFVETYFYSNSRVENTLNRNNVWDDGGQVWRFLRGNKRGRIIVVGTPDPTLDDPVQVAIKGPVGLACATDSVSACQSGAWTVAATQSGAWTVAATQSGVWTVQQGTPPWAMNITQYGGVATTLGQKVSASSIPVVLASDSGITPRSANTGNYGFVTVTGTATQLRPANASRIELFYVNNSKYIIYEGLDNLVTTSTGKPIYPGGTGSINFNNMYTGAVFLITGGASADVRWQEV